MKSVPIKVYIKDKLVSQGSDWELGLWEYTQDRFVWGLVYAGEPTQMAYNWPKDNAKAIGVRNREHFKNDPDYNWRRWYFDVGRRLYVTDDDLEHACKLLDIWEIPEDV